jgi:hypothetical protein
VTRRIRHDIAHPDTKYEFGLGDSIPIWIAIAQAKSADTQSTPNEATRGETNRRAHVLCHERRREEQSCVTREARGAWCCHGDGNDGIVIANTAVKMAKNTARSKRNRCVLV